MNCAALRQREQGRGRRLSAQAALAWRGTWAIHPPPYNWADGAMQHSKCCNLPGVGERGKSSEGAGGASGMQAEQPSAPAGSPQPVGPRAAWRRRRCRLGPPRHLLRWRPARRSPPRARAFARCRRTPVSLNRAGRRRSGPPRRAPWRSAATRERAAALRPELQTLAAGRQGPTTRRPSSPRPRSRRGACRRLLPHRRTRAGAAPPGASWGSGPLRSQQMGNARRRAAAAQAAAGPGRARAQSGAPPAPPPPPHPNPRPSPRWP